MTARRIPPDSPIAGGADVAVARSPACIILPVQTDSVPMWTAGPLPVMGRTTAEATIDRRATYFLPRAARALYGDPGDGGAIGAGASEARSATTAGEAYRPRVHRQDIGEAGENLHGAEVLTLPPYVVPNTSLFVLHVDLGADPVEALDRWVRIERPNAPLLAVATTLLGPDIAIDRTTRRARSVSLVTFDGPVPDTYRIAGLTPEEGWLWLLASATPVGRYPPDFSGDGFFGDVVRLSASWRALVLRDGVGFLGLEADGPFFEDAEQYVRSIYLDAVLLATTQRIVLDSFANSLSRFDDRFESGRELRTLDRQLTYFRNTLWWRQIAHAGPAQDILRATQCQLGLEEMFQDVAADISDFARQVQSEVEFRTNTALRILTVWALPIGSVLAATPVATDRQGIVPLMLAVLIGLVLGTVLHFSVGRMIDPKLVGQGRPWMKAPTRPSKIS